VRVTRFWHPHSEIGVSECETRLGASLPNIGSTIAEQCAEQSPNNAPNNGWENVETMHRNNALEKVGNNAPTMAGNSVS
jgi:hypothetical protein